MNVKMMSSVLLSVPLSLASSPKYQWIDYFIVILTLDPSEEAACLQQGGHHPRRPPSLSRAASTRGKPIWLPAPANPVEDAPKTGISRAGEGGMMGEMQGKACLHSPPGV